SWGCPFALTDPLNTRLAGPGGPCGPDGPCCPGGPCWPSVLKMTRVSFPRHAAESLTMRACPVGLVDKYTSCAASVDDAPGIARAETSMAHKSGATTCLLIRHVLPGRPISPLVCRLRGVRPRAGFSTPRMGVQEPCDCGVLPGLFAPR